MKTAIKAALKAHGHSEDGAEAIAADVASRVASGPPAVAGEAAEYQVRHVKGRPLMTAHAVSFGGGWLCWVELADKVGGVTRIGPMMAATAAPLG